MRNHPDQTDGASGPALSNAPQTVLPFSTPTSAQQPELAEADVADVQPMQNDPPGSGCNLAVAPCSTAAPAHHAAVAFVQPVQLGISVFYYVMEFAEGRGQIHFHLLGKVVERGGLERLSRCRRLTGQPCLAATAAISGGEDCVV